MSSLQKVSIDPDKENMVLAKLEAMEIDKRYNTPSRYSANSALYPDNLITFSALHIAYMRKYPGVDPDQYIQNLKLITLVR